MNPHKMVSGISVLPGGPRRGDADLKGNADDSKG